MKKGLKKKLTGTLLASLIVFSGAMPAAYAEPVSKPNKISGNAEIAQHIAEEGTVLLKNDYNALPLKKSDNVAGLGSAQDVAQIFGGGGSGWVNAIDTTSYRQGLENAAKNGYIKSYRAIGSAADGGAYSKVIYFVGRSTTEGEDLKPNQYYLDEIVKNDITALVSAYGKEKVIVVLNVGTVCDTTWLIEKDVAAIVCGYYGGEQAGAALANILTGVVNPSGKTVDTWAKSYDYYPSSDASGIGTFAGDRNTYYTEDVYVGYRYFQTFDPDYEKVNYEFGYGLSYTKFRMDNYTFAYKDGMFSVSADITNIGVYPGKEVMQVYFEAPKGIMGAPAAELAGFAKTDLLKPGESQTLSITFAETEFARYDDLGKIKADSWVIEKGDYILHVGNSIKNAYSNTASYTHSVKDNTVIETTSHLRDTTLSKRLLSDGTYEKLGASESLTPVYTVPAAGSVVVQAEDYVSRVGSATSESYFVGTDDGIGLGNLNLTGTRLAYDLHVEKAGTYRMNFNFSAAWDGQTDMFRVYANGTPQPNVVVSMNKTHTDTDGLWHTYTHLKSDSWTIDLPAGDVKLEFVANGLKMMNFDSFTIYNNDVSPTETTLVQAETFTASSGGVTVFPDGTATQNSNKAGNTYEYKLNVEKAGAYYLSLFASNVTGASDDAIAVTVNDAPSDAKIALMRTAADGNVLKSNYFTFKDSAPAAIELPQGEVTLKFTTKNTALCSFDSFKLIPEALYTPGSNDYVDNTDDFEYITDMSGKTLDTFVTYDDVYADHDKVDDFVSQMSIAELTRLTGLDGDMNDAQTGTGGVGGMHLSSKYKIPFANTSDGPAGIRYVNNQLYSTWFPCMTLLASTWNTELAYSFGEGVALEAMLGGVNVWLAPGVNIHRNPLCGRNFEYFSEDPLIAGTFAAEITKASQSYGVSVCVKHYAANNQETNRFSNNSSVSARALREIYLKPFEIVVKNADPFSIMSCYNRINGEYGASSYDLITDVLRTDWGFDGAVFSDWSASMTHISLIKSGNTFKSNNPQYDELVKAYQSGVLSREDLERNAKDCILFLIKSNARGQKTTILDHEYVNELGDANITKTVNVENGKIAFIKFSVTKAGYYRFDTLSANGTIKAHSGSFELKDDEPVFLSVGTHELAVEYDGTTIGAIGVKKTADPTPPTDPEDPDDKPSGPNNNKSDGDGLSGGAIAGIAIGSVAAVALVGAGTFLATKKRKTKKSSGSEETATVDPETKDNE